jgi:hypothetical protein
MAAALMTIIILRMLKIKLLSFTLVDHHIIFYDLLEFCSSLSF